MLRKTLAVTVLGLFMAISVSTAGAATVNYQLVIDPAAVGCVGCTLSGANTYQVFADSQRRRQLRSS